MENIQLLKSKSEFEKHVEVMEQILEDDELLKRFTEASVKIAKAVMEAI